MAKKISFIVFIIIISYSNIILSQSVSDAENSVKNVIDIIEQENSLSNFKILSKDNIEKLASNDINNREDLADLSVDELLEMIELSKEDAGKLIMDAREPWFNED